MEYDSNSKQGLPEMEQGLSPELRDLLRDSCTAGDFMSWDRVTALVESAPPVALPWYVAFLDSYQRQLRFAAAPLMVLLLVGGMWAVPAQSRNVGTTIVVQLPADWTHDSPQFVELRESSRSEFENLGISQSGMKLFLIDDDSTQQLVVVMRGVAADQADAWYGRMAASFPVLDAVRHEAHPIEARMHDNLLQEVGSRLGGSQAVSELSDNQLSLLVFEVLGEAGFSNIRLDIQRADSGKVRIDVQADMDGTGSTSELSLQELQQLGYTSGNLGPDASNTLIDEIGVEIP